MPPDGGRRGIAGIGYERRSVEELVDVLLADGVRTVVDVRADPVSRRPDFGGKRLRGHLEASGLGYVQMTDLGVPASVRKGHGDTDGEEHVLDWYRGYLDTHPELVDRVAMLGRGPRVALLCYERDARHCHRGVLSDRLRAMGLDIKEL